MSQREHIAENALVMIAGGHYRGDVADYAQQVLNEINAAPDQPAVARPLHRCGDPSDVCDTDCMDRAHQIEMRCTCAMDSWVTCNIHNPTSTPAPTSGGHSADPA